MSSILSISICIFPIIIFITIGLLIRYKKAYWLISGYNTMSAEKKKNVDTEGLGKSISNLCFTFAVLFIVAALLMYFHKTAMAGLVFSLILPVIIYTLINSQKYDGNTRNQEGRMKTGTKVLIGTIITILVLTSIGVGALLYTSSKPATYSIESGFLKISGIYGQEVSINEISELELKETLPKVLIRTNGSALDSMLKGNFRLQDIGAAKLFVDTSEPPFIYLKYNSKVIFINCEDSKKTGELYNTINEEWKNNK